MKCAGYFLDCLSNVGKIASSISPQRLDVFCGADRMMDYRALASLKFEVEAHRFQGKQNIGKDDSGIHTEALCRGDCNFSRQSQVSCRSQ